jgi:UDP-GlcNAc:undecaprenyl-phosphate GlcNAc-1-phosphate transferase
MKTVVSELLSGSAAFVGCLVTVPFVRMMATKFRLYDPISPLKIHTKPIARVGGIAIVVGLVSGITIAHGLSDVQIGLGFYIALAVVFLTGLLDDVLEISPVLRLFAQTIAAFALWWGTEHKALLGIPALGFATECLVILIFVNAFNFLDGADGVASGVVATLAFGFVFLGTTTSATVISVVLLGSCLGFLIGNFPPATIFMGDCGSTTLGFLIAYLSIQFWHSLPTTSSEYLIPVLFVAIPLLDMSFAVIRRLRSGMSITQGDRRHGYDLLLRRGWAARDVALCFYTASAVTVFLGWICQGRGWRFTWAAAALVVSVSAFLAASLGSFSSETSQGNTSLRPRTSPPAIHS